MPIRDVSPELGLITRQVAVEPSGDDDDEYDELDSESGGSVAEEQYTVEAILAQKTINNEMRYNIKWQGYEETTWEPIEVSMRGSVLLLVSRLTSIHPGSASMTVKSS